MLWGGVPPWLGLPLPLLHLTEAEQGCEAGGHGVSSLWSRRCRWRRPQCSQDRQTHRVCPLGGWSSPSRGVTSAAPQEGELPLPRSLALVSTGLRLEWAAGFCRHTWARLRPHLTHKLLPSWPEVLFDPSINIFIGYLQCAWLRSTSLDTTDSKPELAELRLANKQLNDDHQIPQRYSVCMFPVPAVATTSPWVKATQIYYLYVLEVRSPNGNPCVKIKLLSGCVAPEALGWNSFPHVFRPLQAAVSLDSSPPVSQARRRAASPASASESQRPGLWPLCLAPSLIRTLVVTGAPTPRVIQDRLPISTT